MYISGVKKKILPNDLPMIFFFLIVALSDVCGYFIFKHVLSIFMCTWGPVIAPNSFQITYFSIYISAIKIFFHITVLTMVVGVIKIGPRFGWCRFRKDDRENPTSSISSTKATMSNVSGLYSSNCFGVSQKGYISEHSRLPTSQWI